MFALTGKSHVFSRFSVFMYFLDRPKGVHYENMSMQYTVICKVVKNENFQYF